MRLDTITYLCIVLVTRVPSRDCSAYSGVIKVGVTRCGNWWCHPFLPRKSDDLFRSTSPLAPSPPFHVIVCPLLS